MKSSSSDPIFAVVHCAIYDNVFMHWAHHAVELLGNQANRSGVDHYLIIEEDIGEGAGQLSLTHSGRSGENERSDEEAGTVFISPRDLGNRQLKLVVADNGIGKAYAPNTQGTGFGSRLIRLLTRQLNEVAGM